MQRETEGEAAGGARHVKVPAVEWALHSQDAQGRASRWQLDSALWPALLLVAALSSVFWFGHDRGYFYRPHHAATTSYPPVGSIHNWASAKNLALAANLSWRSGFRDRSVCGFVETNEGRCCRRDSRARRSRASGYRAPSRSVWSRHFGFVADHALLFESVDFDVAQAQQLG